MNEKIRSMNIKIKIQKELGVGQGVGGKEWGRGANTKLI